MKRALFTLAAALLFLNVLVIPTVVHADGPPDGTNCKPGEICKP
jgi:hypothetical protein